MQRIEREKNKIQMMNKSLNASTSVLIMEMHTKQERDAIFTY